MTLCMVLHVVVLTLCTVVAFYPSGPQYLDCTLVKALFSVHMVFCVSPITRVMSQAADELQEKVVTILSLFSIGNKTLGTGEGELCAGSLWAIVDTTKVQRCIMKPVSLIVAFFGSSAVAST